MQTGCKYLYRDKEFERGTELNNLWRCVQQYAHNNKIKCHFCPCVCIFLSVFVGGTSTISPVPTQQLWALWTLMQDTGSWSSKFLLKSGNKEMVACSYYCIVLCGTLVTLWRICFVEGRFINFCCILLLYSFASRGQRWQAEQYLIIYI